MNKVITTKLLSIIVALFCMFSLLPPAMAEAVSTASAYNVYIDGNFTVGETITAHYEYYDPDGGNEVGDPIYSWYISQEENTAALSPVQQSTSNEFVLTSAHYVAAGNKNNIFVSVTTSNNDGAGNPVYSRFYSEVKNTDSTTAPSATGAYIMPTNPEGTTDAGDTVKAYFAYHEPSGLEAGDHLYEWSTYESVNNKVPVVVQEESTDSSYVIKQADFGKYLECKITPVASDGTQGTPIVTVNSLGNLFNNPNVTATFLREGAYGNGSYFRWNPYPVNLLLGDSATPATSYGSFLQGRYANLDADYDAGIVFDIGEERVFNGFYFNSRGSSASIPDMTLSYSLTGENGSWVDAVTFDTGTSAFSREYLLDAPANARFFKFDYNTRAKITLCDFYPIATVGILPKINLVGGETIYVMVGDSYEEPGYSAVAGDGTDLTDMVQISGDVVNTDEIGTYEVIYSVTHGTYPTVEVKRTVLVDSGVRTEGDLAYKADVDSVNAQDSSKLVDGNSNTVWSTTDTPASAVIDLVDVQPFSRFVINEDGENVSEYTISVSEDGDVWNEVCEGTTLGETVLDFDPVSARYVKLDIAQAEDTVRIKDFEIHLSDAGKLSLAKKALTIDANLDYVGENITLPTSGLYNTVVTWASSNESLLLADGTVVARPTERTTVTLTATIKLGNNAPLTKEFIATVLPPSLPIALDVYVKGNLIIGEELSCEYTYYDPAGLPEDTAGAQYQWYRCNDSATDDSGAISGATSKTYTLTDAEKNYHVYVKVTPKSFSDTGLASFSAISALPVTVSTEDIPVVSGQYISSLSPNHTMVSGDTVRVHYTYQERGLTPEGATTYLWVTRDAIGGVPKTVQAESTNDTYTLTDDDYGKVIECIINPISASGLRGKSVTARNHYGNGFLGDDVVSYTGTSWMYTRKGINAGRVYCYEEPGYNYINLTGSIRETIFSMDAGKSIDFDAIYVAADYAMKDIRFEYSTDGENYTEIVLPEESRFTSANSGKEIKFDHVIKAQYLKLYMTNTSKDYYTMKAFYPYITSDAGSKIIVTNPDGEEVCQYETFTDDTYSALDPYGNDATANVQIEGSVNTALLGNYPVTYTLEVPGYPSVSVSKIFKVVEGVATEGDIAFRKSITANGDASKLVDGNPYTSWIAPSANEEIVIDLGSKSGFSSVYIGENTSNIQSVTIYSSQNGVDWSVIAENTALTEGSVSFEPVQAQYIKVKLNASAAPELHSVEVFVEDAARVKFAKENLNLSGDLTNVTNDLALPRNGDYGVSITWESSAPSVINTEGAVTRGSEDQTVTLTATLSNDALTLTKTFTVIVKKSSGVDDSGSSGGSRSEGFGIFVNPTPETPVTPVTPVGSYKVFKDVPNTHWAAEYINVLSERNIISGKGNGLYEPEANITRAEYLKLLIESLGLTADISAAEAFTDVSDESWYAKYVKIATVLGIANGTGNGAFSPDAPILRRDMAVLAHRAVAAAGKELKAGNSVVLADHDTISEYAKAAVKALSDAGIINGNENGEFMPDALANRAQSAKIIYMLKEMVKE